MSASTGRVIVVGAGPVGLMLAGELRLGGVEVDVYERLAAPARESRGASITRRAVECLAQRGLAERLGDHEPADSHFGGIPIDLALLPDDGDDHSGARGVPQWRTEQMLADWATELGARVRRGHEVTGLREQDGEVVVSMDTQTGPLEDRAAFVVGCDGGRSAVRTLAGIGFTGAQAKRGFFTADVTGLRTRRRRTGEDLPGGSMVMAMDLEGGVTRVVVHEHGTRPVERASLRFEHLADAWQRLTGESIHHAECRWLNCFTDASRVATAYRSGRVLLAGDAAHVQPPAMAQGLSVGLQDAVNLGWKLAAVVRGDAPDTLLSTYETERLPVGRQLARNAAAAIELRLSGDEMTPLRSVIAELSRQPTGAARLAGMLSGLHIRYDVGPGSHHLLGARLAPDRRIDPVDGENTRLAEVLRAARGVLITATAKADVEQWRHSVDVVVGRVDASAETVLVRPDGYVAWTAPGADLALQEALHTWFGAPRQVQTAQTVGTV